MEPDRPPFSRRRSLVAGLLAAVLAVGVQLLLCGEGIGKPDLRGRVTAAHETGGTHSTGRHSRCRDAVFTLQLDDGTQGSLEGCAGDHRVGQALTVRRPDPFDPRVVEPPWSARRVVLTALAAGALSGASYGRGDLRRSAPAGRPSPAGPPSAP